MNKLVVVGSISTDFVVNTEQIPSQGETVFGEHFEILFGGKGANQAVAAARLGASVKMLGAVGDDVFGEQTLNNLQENGIDISSVERVTHTSTGAAVITIYNNDNAIIYTPGANGKVNAETVQNEINALGKGDIVLIQNEVSEEVVATTIASANRVGCKVVLNPAPARPIDETLIEQVTFLTPNESEYKVLFGDTPIEDNLKKYPNKLLVTLGDEGVIFHNGAEIVHVPANKVDVLDTTGAGDTFNGAFCASLLNGLSIETAIRFANVASALSVQAKGAQGGMPYLNEMKESDYYQKEWDQK